MLKTLELQPDYVERDLPVQMRTRQMALKDGYITSPQSAIVTDHARSVASRIPTNQPLYGTIEMGENNPVMQDIALHAGVGGYSDLPVPGDILCGAIAGCLDSVIRVISNHLGIVLSELEVTVEADVDLRGTLMVDPSVPVGFQKIRINAHIVPAIKVPKATLQAILSTAERCCVVLQTVRNAPDIEVTPSWGEPPQDI